jgi:chromosome segregation and condensation protein ScpB
MELKFILESLLFSAQKPLSVKELRDVFAAAAEAEDADATAKSLAKVRDSELTTALEQLASEHESAARSYRLACVAGAWQFVTQPEYSP